MTKLFLKSQSQLSCST